LTDAEAQQFWPVYESPLGLLKTMAQITKTARFMAFVGIASIQPPLLALFCLPPASAASLELSTSRAWDDHVASAIRRMEQRVASGQPFLWVDEAPARPVRLSCRQEAQRIRTGSQPV
jgi:hypothetical protein